MADRQLDAPGAAADGLCDPATRDATLDTLEAHGGAHDAAVTLAAAPVIVEAMAADVELVDARTFQRLGFLLGRMVRDATAEESLALYAAIWGDGRVAALYNSPHNAVARALETTLTPEDALTMAALEAGCGFVASTQRGGASTCCEALLTAAGLSVPEFWALFTMHPLGTKRLASDALPKQLITLALELLRSPEHELAPAVAAGLFQSMIQSVSGRPASQQHAQDSGLCEVTVAHMRANGRPEEYIRISSKVATVVSRAICANYNIRVDTNSGKLLASGLFDESIAILQAFEARGVEAVGDTNADVIYGAVNIILKMCSEPSCRSKIRSAASALKFAIDNDLLILPSTGHGSAACATQICASMFGRDAGGGFTFTQAHVDAM